MIQPQDLLFAACIVAFAAVIAYRLKNRKHDRCRDMIVEFWENYIGPNARKGRPKNPRHLDVLQLKVSIECLKKRNVYETSVDEDIRHDLRFYEQTT